MPRLGLAVAAIFAGVVIGLIFKAIYPSVPITAQLAFLFVLIGVGLTLGLSLLWHAFKSKPE